ncbi:hypothetical protein Nepgr_025886 [Nepenthes gracilis]|uniref:Uncharacterized protein n=1 Tax=Nepenthes gracilis TaxID=150966 RepID=A0AAD3Y036_NEPGR|nr:hypothetical protein Nepgr_025886 [Nepenthes gracilis]
MSARALIFSGFASIPRWKMMKPRNFPEATPKMHSAGFSLLTKHPKRLWQIADMVACGSVLDEHVVNIDFHIAVDLFLKYFGYQPLVGGSCVLRSKGYHLIAVSSLVCHKQDFINVDEIDAHSLLPTAFLYQDYVGEPIGSESSPNLWIITRAKIPGMSVGVHAKMSAFRRRIVISSSSSAPVAVTKTDDDVSSALLLLPYLLILVVCRVLDWSGGDYVDHSCRNLISWRERPRSFLARSVRALTMALNEPSEMAHSN